MAVAQIVVPAQLLVTPSMVIDPNLKTGKPEQLESVGFHESEKIMWCHTPVDKEQGIGPSVQLDVWLAYCQNPVTVLHCLPNIPSRVGVTKIGRAHV